MKKMTVVFDADAPIKNTKGMLKGKTSLVRALTRSRREDAARGK